MISVIVPAYNRRETLGTTLDSLQAQTYRNWCAIVVDDGSIDDTASLVEHYAEQDPRIGLHRQANGGVSKARNAGIGLANTPWTFFLDADDWIVPHAFERLTATAAANPSADAVYGGYVRVDNAGRELQVPLPDDEPDLFRVFARTCAISVHACLVKTEIIRRAGGFDESLITCEDWDLWQRIARVGAHFVAIADYIAYYRMRLDSASGSGWRMLRDGLLVIDRGYGEDPRVPAAAPSNQQSLQADNESLSIDEQSLPTDQRALSIAARDLARTYFLCYAAGLEIAAGNDARSMIEELGEGISPDVDPDGIAETLFLAIPVGRATASADWAGFPAIVHQLCDQFIEALGERLGSYWLAFGARNALERLVLAETHDERPRRTGRWYIMDLDIEGPPPQDLMLEAGVQRILCTVRCGEEHLGDLEIAVVDYWVPARVLADAVVASLGWDVLQAFLERHVYPDLEVERTEEQVRVTRDGATLFEGSLNPARTARQGIHDSVGWTIFLQELWDRRSMSGEQFYDGGRNTRSEPGSRLTVGEQRIELDIAAPLPALQVSGRDTVSVAVTVGGAPLTVVDCQPQRGRISAHQLRRAILIQAGYELCRVVMREAVILAPTDAEGSLHERLAGALAASRAAPLTGDASPDRSGAPAGVTTIGRSEGPDGTAISRWMVLPAAVAEERLALARRDGDPVAGAGAGAVQRLLAAPLLLESPTNRRQLSDSSLLRSIEFERIFTARSDPWHYDSAYERDKYDQTMTLLPDTTRRALELGCAEGAFTGRLAARAEELTAADISLMALSRASRRCAEHANVVFMQMDAFEGSIGGPYDLIVCSETLYYAESRATLESTARALALALEPGGHLLTAHANVVADDPRVPGFDWDVPFGAATIEATMLSTGLLDPRREISTPAYRIQLYSRRRSRWRRSRTERTRSPAGAMDPDSAKHFLPNGGEVRRETSPEQAPSTTRLPILMYHRVAPEGKAATQRWRVHPDAFEEQLRHLRDRGYQSLTFEQWRAASDRRQPIPDRSVMLTFDDGYCDFPVYALPLLEKYGFAATMFIVTDLIGGSNVWDADFGESIALMDWPTIRELQARGVEIGSHSSLHRPLVSLSIEELTRDLSRSRMSFHDNLGMAVRSVCYPYGLHDTGVLAMAGACGFRYGVTTNEWHASFGDDLLRLPRVEVRGTDPLSEFIAKLKA